MNSFFIVLFLNFFQKIKSYIFFPIIFKEKDKLNFIENLIQTEVYTNIRIGTIITTTSTAAPCPVLAIPPD